MIVSKIVHSEGFGVKPFAVFSTLLLIVSVVSLCIGRFFELAHEDIQKYLFFIFIICLFIFSRFFIHRVPGILFVLAVFCWLVLAFRIPVMHALGFFSGRIVIGKFDNDAHGLEARELYQGLRKIGLTYNLPGPVALPLSKGTFENSAYRRMEKEFSWKKSSRTPALFIFSNNSHYEVHFPQIFLSSVSSPDVDIDLPGNFERVTLKGFKKDFLLPYIPEYLVVPETPALVIYHYLSWLSAFFHSEIRRDPVSVIDVINEAARISGPWSSQLPRVFARYLFTLQEFVLWHQGITDYEVDLLRARLGRAMRGLEAYPNQELEVQIRTLDALCMLARYGDRESFDSARSILGRIVSDDSIPIKVKLPAIYNLGVLLEEG